MSKMEWIDILVDGQLVDTYGGNHVYRDVHYSKNEDGTYNFYERFYGQASERFEDCQITDPDEIAELTLLIKE